MLPKIFVCYSRKDSRWVVTPKGATEPALIPWLRDKFRRHPAGIELWWDEALDRRVGEAYDTEIAEAIASSQTAILLVSDDFFISEYISQHELPQIRERVERGEMQLFPIVVGHVDWGQNADSLWLHSRQIHPSAISPLIEIIESPSAWNRTRTQLSVALREQVLSFKPRRPGEPVVEQPTEPRAFDGLEADGTQGLSRKFPIAPRMMKIYAAIAVIGLLIAVGVFASMRGNNSGAPSDGIVVKPPVTPAPTATPTAPPNPFDPIPGESPTPKPTPTPTPIVDPFATPDRDSAAKPPRNPFLSEAEEKALDKLKTPITISFLQPNSLRKFLDTIKLLSGIDYLVAGDLDIDSLTISGLNFDDRPLNQVLDLVCNTYKLKWEFQPSRNVIVVEPKVTLESRDFPIYIPNNPFLSPTQFTDEVRREVETLLYSKTGFTKAAAEGRTTTFNSKTNTLTVRDTPARLAEVAALLLRKAEAFTPTNSTGQDPFGSTPTPRSPSLRQGDLDFLRNFRATPTPRSLSPFGETPKATPSPTPSRYF